MARTFKDMKPTEQVKARLAQEIRAKSRVRLTEQMLRHVVEFTESIH